MKIAVYPGSFDPITNGHLDIIERAAKLFDKVIVLCAINPNKKYKFDTETRVKMAQEACKKFKNVTVDSSEGLTVSYANKVGATVLIRGLRMVSDFEYEWQLFGQYNYLDKDLEIIYLMAKSETSFISSSMITNMRENGVDVSGLVPTSVMKQYKKSSK